MEAQEGFNKGKELVRAGQFEPALDMLGALLNEQVDGEEDEEEFDDAEEDDSSSEATGGDDGAASNSGQSSVKRKKAGGKDSGAHPVDPETQARLEALLEAAGIGKLSGESKQLADPEVRRGGFPSCLPFIVLVESRLMN